MQYAALLGLLLMACGASSQEPKAPARPDEVAADTGAHAPMVAPASPQLLWWQGATPACEQGELKRRNLTWGSVFWCARDGLRVDQNLQNDLSRLARCVHESVSAFQEEPNIDKLGEFLARAHESGLNAVLCSAVRRDAEVRTYHGRLVLMERRVESKSENELEVRYRFSCEGCTVAAETTARVAAP